MSARIKGMTTKEYIEWLGAVRVIDRAHADLRERAVESFKAMATAAEQEARRAQAAWRAVSYTAPKGILNPAAQRSQGKFRPDIVGTDFDGNPTYVNENKVLDLIRQNNENSLEFDPATGEYVGGSAPVGTPNVPGRMRDNENIAGRVNRYNESAATDDTRRSVEPDYGSGDFGI